MNIERRFKMKRFSAMVVVGMVAILAGLALAAETEKTPDATLKLSEGQVAVGIGWSWGKGVLTLNGKDYPFKVGGLSVLDVGITKAEAEGKVYNLKKLADFNGTYVSAAAAATLGVGAGATAMKNDKGVVIHLFPKTKGVNLKLAGEGVKLTLEKK
ncbi:MAG: hypothetical protein WAV72_10285 [Bradyrhizobium sp.]